MLFYLTDDRGYGDVGSYGVEGQCTPAIDRLAEEGIEGISNSSTVVLVFESFLGSPRTLVGSWYGL